VFTQGVSSGGITGEPTTEGVFAFTIQVRDATGTKDTESFSITINPPRPLVITNQSDALSPGTVGEFYCCGNLFADGPGHRLARRDRRANVLDNDQLRSRSGAVSVSNTTDRTLAVKPVRLVGSAA
jgi:hypothetical protein